MSAFELSKGHAKPIDDRPAQVADEVVNASLDIQARRKLARILRSKGNVEL